MKLELAIVETCSPEGCQVKMLNDGRGLAARYSALVQDRVKIRPGQMVAVDIDPGQPEIAWRWYRGKVVESTAEWVTVDDRGCRTLNAIRAPGLGLETDLVNGTEVWLTGMGGTWEVHDRVERDAPAHPEPLLKQVLPRIADLLSKA